MRYEAENMRYIPAAACVARFWAQPPKYIYREREKERINIQKNFAGVPVAGGYRLPLPARTWKPHKRSRSNSTIHATLQFPTPSRPCKNSLSRREPKKAAASTRLRQPRWGHYETVLLEIPAIRDYRLEPT